MSERKINQTLTKELLYEEYHINNLSIDEIKKKYKTSKREPRRLLLFYEIPLKTKNEIYSERRNKKISNTINSHDKKWFNEKENKTKETCKEKYGVDNPSKNNEIKEKIKKNINFKLRYLKIKQTLKIKYGVDNPVYIDGVIEKISKSFNNNQKANRKISLNEKEFCERLYNKLLLEKIIDTDEKVFFSPKTKQFGKYDKKFKSYKYYDFVIPRLKICIEYNGDYWHANPEIYDSDFKLLGITAKEIWLRDERKINLIKNLDFNVILIWDNNFINNKDICILNTVEEIKKRITSCI